MADKPGEKIYYPSKEDREKYEKELEEQEGDDDPDYQERDNSNTGPRSAQLTKPAVK